MRRKPMKTKPALMTSSKISLIISAILISCALRPFLKAAPEAKKDAAGAPEASQRQFATPNEAAESLIQAAASYDVTALREILGADNADIVSSEDPVMDKNQAMAFADKAKEKNVIAKDP